VGPFVNAGAIIWWPDANPAATGGAVEFLAPQLKAWTFFGS